MASMEKILIDIADAAQRVLNAVSCASDKKDKNLNLSRMRLGGQLQRIIAASQTILKENIDNSAGSHSTQDILDDRLTDWLATDDPRICLASLNAMEKVVKPSHSPQTFRNLFRSAPTEDKVNDALTILDKRKDCFHFLLTTDVWNRETIIRDQPRADEPVKGVRLGAREHGQARTSVGTSATRDGPFPQPRQSKKEVDPKQLDDVLQWLGAWNCRPKHEDTLDLRQPDTCKWLPGKPAYEAWRENDNSFLWLNGKPGSGKSVLAASVIDVLERTLRDGEQLAYFYCDFRSERSTNSAEVMRSLLTQLLRSFRDGTVDPGDVIDDLIKEKERAGSLLKNAKRLALLISSAAKQFPQQPLIVVDALDECNDIEPLLDALAVLNQGGMRLFVTSRPLQVINDSFTGLPSISLERMWRVVSADIELHVTRVVDSHRRLRIASDDLKRELRSTLLKKADGMFRWIQCQLDNLKRCVTAVQLRETLENLPAGLEETYERILRAVDKDEREASIARRALVWLVAALKPLRLSQLLEALSIDLGGRTLNPNLGPMHGPALLDALSSLVTYNNRTDIVILSHFSVKEYLLRNFKHPSPLYRIDLQEAHSELARCCMCYLVANLRRVREFGRGVDHVISRGVMQSGDAGVFHAPSHGKAAIMAPESLLEYVISDGFRHLAHVRPRDKAALDAIRALSLDVQQYPLKWNRLRKRSPFRSLYHDSRPSLQDDFVLYILIAFASEPLLRLHLGRGPLKAREGTNPLVYAASAGRIEHARTLLSRGASLNCTDRSSQVLPLHAAAREGHIDLVNLFLSEGSHVPEQLFSELLDTTRYPDFAPPIIARLLQTDQFVEWVSQQQDEALLNVLRMDGSFLRAKLREEDFVVMKSRLMQVNCDPSSHGGFMKKLLRQAVATGHISIAQHIHSELHDSLPSDILLHVSHSGDTSAAMIRFLIAHGANVSCSTADEATALHFAIGRGRSSQGEEECMQKIRVLIDAGCNPSAQNLSRETPLHLAAARGYISVIKYLLSLGVSVPSNIILAASRGRRPAILHLFISKGADVNVIAVDGNTPLHILLDSTGTASAECLECAEILFGAGLDPYARNSIGETPLDIAARCGNVSVIAYFIAGNQPPPPNLLFSALFSRDPIPVIQLLLTQRVDVSAIDFYGNNAIHRTLAKSGLEDQCLEIVEVLVRAGCDPCIPNSAGQTPFHFATGKGYTLVMEYLLSLGAQPPADIIPYLLDRTPWSWPNCEKTTIQFLAEKGVRMHVVAENGDTLLHRCIAQFLEPELLDVAQILVGAGCSPSATNLDLQTPLHIASRYGHIAVLDYLLSLEVPLPSDILLAAVQGSEIALVTSFLSEGADPKAVTPSGDTVLHLALMGGMEADRLKTAKILINAGCNINARNSAGETLIHAAVRGGHITILEYLLAKGLLFPPDILLTAAVLSSGRDKTRLIRFLINGGANARVIAPDGNSLLHLVNSEFSLELEIMTVLINSGGCDPSLRNMDGETPLHIAASHGNAPVFKYLVSLQGTLPPKDHTTRTGDTLLHLALPSGGLEGRLEILAFLIDLGYDPLVRNLAGKSPIHIAAKGGDFFVVKYLLSQQVPLPSDILHAAVSGNMRDSMVCNHIIPMINLLTREGADPGVAAVGNTPLHAILAHDFRDEDDGKPVGFLWEVVEILLNSGCDPSARNNDGRTAFDLAEAKGPSFLRNFARLANSTGT